jgi:hypothetical protein
MLHAPPLPISGKNRRAAPIHEIDRAASCIEIELLFLDLRLERKGPGYWWRQTRLDPIGQARCQPFILEIRFQNNPRRFVLATTAAPHGRLHAAFPDDLCRKIAFSSRLDQLQSPIEVGFTSAVFTDEHRHLPKIKPDRTQRTIAFGRKGNEAHDLRNRLTQ